jgi:TPR repeat protein
MTSYSISVNFTDFTNFPKNINFAELFQECSKFADKGHPIACNNLGYLYQNGKGTPVNYDKAFNLYSTSVELGNSYAMINLGHMYNKGQGRESDHKMALKWYLASAEKHNSHGMYELAVMRQRLEDWTDALRIYKQSCDLGNSNAMVNLGILYQYGNSTIEKNEKLAVEYFNKSVNLGNAYAMNLLAHIYKDGNKVCKVDYNKSYELFKQSIEYGNDSAIQNLSELFLKSKDPRIPQRVNLCTSIITDLMNYADTFPESKVQLENIFSKCPDALLTLMADTFIEFWKQVNSKKQKVEN